MYFTFVRQLRELWLEPCVWEFVICPAAGEEGLGAKAIRDLFGFKGFNSRKFHGEWAQK